jgi:hypothetical protein
MKCNETATHTVSVHGWLVYVCNTHIKEYKGGRLMTSKSFIKCENHCVSLKEVKK